MNEPFPGSSTVSLTIICLGGCPAASHLSGLPECRDGSRLRTVAAGVSGGTRWRWNNSIQYFKQAHWNSCVIDVGFGQGERPVWATWLVAAKLSMAADCAQSPPLAAATAPCAAEMASLADMELPPLARSSAAGACCRLRPTLVSTQDVTSQLSKFLSGLGTAGWTSTAEADIRSSQPFIMEGSAAGFSWATARRSSAWRPPVMKCIQSWHRCCCCVRLAPHAFTSFGRWNSSSLAADCFRKGISSQRGR